MNHLSKCFIIKIKQHFLSNNVLLRILGFVFIILKTVFSKRKTQISLNLTKNNVDFIQFMNHLQPLYSLYADTCARIFQAKVVIATLLITTLLCKIWPTFHHTPVFLRQAMFISMKVDSLVKS